MSIGKMKRAKLKSASHHNTTQSAEPNLSTNDQPGLGSAHDEIAIQASKYAQHDHGAPVFSSQLHTEPGAAGLGISEFMYATPLIPLYSPFEDLYQAINGRTECAFQMEDTGENNQSTFGHTPDLSEG